MDLFHELEIFVRDSLQSSVSITKGYMYVSDLANRLIANLAFPQFSFLACTLILSIL